MSRPQTSNVNRRIAVLSALIALIMVISTGVLQMGIPTQVFALLGRTMVGMTSLIMAVVFWKVAQDCWRKR